MTERFGLGLPQDRNRLAPYNPDWAAAFAEEAARLKAALGDAVIAIEHYGSTSIPGLAAKPILDLLVGVADLAQVPALSDTMAGLGYEDRGREDVPGHHIFGRGVARTHLAHFVGHGGRDWLAPLTFRDRMRADPNLRDAYLALKTQLVAEHPTDRAAYTAGKAGFVAAVLAG